MYWHALNNSIKTCSCTDSVGAQRCVELSL